MTTTTTPDIGPARADERAAVVALFAAGQVRPERHVCYLSLDAGPIAEELAGLEPDGWDGVLVARDDGRIVGALAAEHDAEPPRVWWHGPAVAEDHPFGPIAGLLLDAGRARLPGHVTEEELAGDEQHAELAALASQYGFETAPASAALSRTCEPMTGVPDLPVRPFTEADRDRIAVIHDVAFPASHRPGHRVDEGTDRFVLVAGPGGDVVGYAAAERHADGSGYLDLVGVAPEARGRGVGAALIAAAVDRLRADGCEVVSLTVRETNLGARRLYDRLGFTEERLVRPFRRGFHLP